MKFINSILFTFLLSTSISFGQETNDALYINMPDGQVIEYNVEHIDSITFKRSAITNEESTSGTNTNLGAAISWIDDDFLIEDYDIYQNAHDWCIENDIRHDFAYIPGWSSSRLATAKSWEEEGFTFLMHPLHSGWYDDATHTHDIVEVRRNLIKCIREFQTNFASSRRTILVFPGSSDTYQDNIDFVSNYVDAAVSATRIGTNSGNEIKKYRIKRFSLLLRDGYPKSKLKELIKTAVDNGDWIILYTHLWSYKNTDVVDETTNSLANLLEIVEYANSLCPIRPTEVIWEERKAMYNIVK